MIRRSLLSVSMLVLTAAPLAAQAYGAEKDPTKKVEGGGAPMPNGWMGRTDRDNTKLSDAKFVAMGSGYHVTSGPAAIYWKTASQTKGRFTATTTMTQTKAPTHPEAYGIFFMGKDLDGANQSYAYFLV